MHDFAPLADFPALTTEQRQLVSNHLHLAEALATRRLSCDRGPDWQDAYQDAVMALMEAASKWDATRGCEFGAFAWTLGSWRMGRTKFRAARSQAMQSTMGGITGDGEDMVTGANDPDPSPSADELLESAQDRAAGQRALDSLPAADREVVAGLLSGQSIRPSTATRILAAITGQRIHLDRPRLTHAQRSRRWHANLSPERKEARRVRQNAQYRARYARRQAPKAVAA
jgi:DNA-directed RNA polymerase specialized sigma24 family protein